MSRWPSTLPAPRTWATSLTEKARSRNGRRETVGSPGNFHMRWDRLTRRELLRRSAGTLLTAGLWPGVLRAEGEGSAGEFRFLVVNDVHYLKEACGKWFEGVLRKMKREKIDFCLLAGD